MYVQYWQKTYTAIYFLLIIYRADSICIGSQATFHSDRRHSQSGTCRDSVKRSSFYFRSLLNQTTIHNHMEQWTIHRLCTVFRILHFYTNSWLIDVPYIQYNYIYLQSYRSIVIFLNIILCLSRFIISPLTD